VLLFVLFCYYCVVLCIDCTVTLPPGVNPIAVDKYILTSALDGVGGQRHAPVALPRERPGTHCIIIIIKIIIIIIKVLMFVVIQEMLILPYLCCHYNWPSGCCVSLSIPKN